jgi:hypothetical protein
VVRPGAIAGQGSTVDTYLGEQVRLLMEKRAVILEVDAPGCESSRISGGTVDAPVYRDCQPTDLLY